MSIAASAVADAAVADWKKQDVKKPGPKRVTTAVRDVSLVPEPR